MATPACDDTVEDVDQALALLAFDQRRISDPERWTAWVDKLLDVRLEIAASN